jgi:ABC-type polysaccharide transport system permease subunit
MNRPGELKRPLLNKKKENAILLVFLLLPFLAMVIVFNYLPIFGWIYSFIDYKPGISVFQSNFVGLKYFIRVFSGTSNFWLVMRNTLGISFLNILFSVVPVIFAIMISHVTFRQYSRFIQTISSIPYFLSWVLVFSVIFHLVSSENSALNRLLLGLGIISTPISVLTDINAAWMVQVLIVLWKNTGYSAIIYLAAISSIDQELYQAADVDGANGWQKILHITIPGIASTYFVLLLLAISNMLSNGFEQYWLFGNGMTWDALEVLDTYVYRMGVQNMEYSFSTAIGIFKSIVSVLLLTIANSASRWIRGKSIF